jgi:hypothetical protein
MEFRDQVSSHINLAAPMNTFAAMLVLYLGSSMVIWLIFRVVRQSIEQLKLRDFDRQMGALVGAAKGGLIACLITLFAVTLLPEQQTQAIIGSRSGYFIARFLNQAQAIMPGEVRQVLGPYLEKLDQPGLGDPILGGNAYDPAGGGTYRAPQFGQQDGHVPTDYGRPDAQQQQDYGDYGRPDPYYIPPTANEDLRADNPDWR